MIEFPPELKESAAKSYSAWKEAASLTAEEKKAKFGRAVRVTAKYLPQLRKEVRAGEFVWYSDARKQVGGKGEYPGAVSIFLSGLPLCQMAHYGERASVQGLKLDDLEVTVIGRFLGISGSGMDEIEYQVRIASQEPPDRIRALAVAASDDCYVTNTLKKSCKVTGKVLLNGEALADV